LLRMRTDTATTCDGSQIIKKEKGRSLVTPFHAHVIPNLYDIIFSVEKRRCLIYTESSVKVNCEQVPSSFKSIIKNIFWSHSPALSHRDSGKCTDNVSWDCL